MEPLTEQRAIPGPNVYGYVRLTRATAARRRALIEAIVQYCCVRELTLNGMFIDRHPAGRPATPAFTGLMDVLALADTYGVVLPSRAHLGPEPTASGRALRITHAGARVLVLRPARHGGRCRSAFPGPMPPLSQDAEA